MKKMKEMKETKMKTSMLLSNLIKFYFTLDDLVRTTRSRLITRTKTRETRTRETRTRKSRTRKSRTRKSRTRKSRTRKSRTRGTRTRGMKTRRTKEEERRRRTRTRTKTRTESCHWRKNDWNSWDAFKDDVHSSILNEICWLQSSSSISIWFFTANYI
jgi:arginine/serine-rich splicing factor 12